MRKRTGQVPYSGGTSSSTFTTRRYNQLKNTALGYVRASRARTPAALITMLPRSVMRVVPAHKARGGPLTYRGRSGKLSGSGPSTDQPVQFYKVGGAAAYPSFGLLPSMTVGAQVSLGTRVDKFGKKRQLDSIKALRNYLNRLIAIAGMPHIGVRHVVWHVGRWCLMEMIAKTPLDTGTAAAGWAISPQVRGMGKGYGRVSFRITTDVEYIKYLEYGHQSYPGVGMMRSTMLEAQYQVRRAMDTLIKWWEKQRITLRGFKFDQKAQAGLPYEDIEKKIPPLAWRQLHNMLWESMPLRDVSELNTSAALAYRIDDPKDWHTYVHTGTMTTRGGWKEPAVTFDYQKVTRRKTEVPDLDDAVNPWKGVPGNSQLVTRYQNAVIPPKPRTIEQMRVEAQAELLRKAWGAR